MAFDSHVYLTSLTHEQLCELIQIEQRLRNPTPYIAAVAGASADEIERRIRAKSDHFEPTEARPVRLNVHMTPEEWGRSMADMLGLERNIDDAGYAAVIERLTMALVVLGQQMMSDRDIDLAQCRNYTLTN